MNMNLSSLLPAMVLLPASLLLAQVEVKEAESPKVSAARTQYQKLAHEYNVLQVDYGQRMQKVTRSEEYRKLRLERDRDGMRELTSKVKRPDVADFVARCQEAAKQHAEVKRRIAPYKREWNDGSKGGGAECDGHGRPAEQAEPTANSEHV